MLEKLYLFHIHINVNFQAVLNENLFFAGVLIFSIIVYILLSEGLTFFITSCVAFLPFSFLLATLCCGLIYFFKLLLLFFFLLYYLYGKGELYVCVVHTKKLAHVENKVEQFIEFLRDFFEYFPLLALLLLFRGGLLRHIQRKKNNKT